MKNCPTLIASGTCNDTSCEHNHNVLVCDVCSLVVGDINKYNKHLHTKRHKNKVETVSHGLLYCPTCDQCVPSSFWAQHKRQGRHTKKSTALGVSTEVEPETDIPEMFQVTHYFCPTCQVYVHRHHWRGHEKGRKHQRGQEYVSFKLIQDEAEKDRNGVTIQGSLDFGILTPSTSLNGVVKSLEVHSSAPLARLTLVSARLSTELGSQTRKLHSPFTVEIQGLDRKLSTLRPIIIIITFKGEFVGHYQDRLEIQFEDLQLKKKFMISRNAQAIVGDSAMYDRMRPIAPYIPRVRAPRESETQVVEGVQPPSLNTIRYASKLPKAHIPKNLLSVLTVSSSPSRENVNSIQLVFLPKVLDPESHGRRLKVLLWIEEHKMEADLENYDMVGSTLSRNAPFYHLEVPGLAEKRPSVLIGDRILVRKEDGQQGHWYAGHVHFVHQYEVGLRFHESFKGWSQSQKYHIRFKLNRIPLQRQHQALDTAFTQSRILFPDSSHLPMYPVPRPRIRLFNNLISNNSSQLEAVGSILSAPPGSLPFVVFGPPGTGKTITIVEAIKQLVKQDTNIRVLACAPSNSAADLIALRLRDTFGKEDMFRLYAPSRQKGQVPDELEVYTYYRGDRQHRPCFSVPPMATMKRYRIIVSTCISASVVSGIGMPRGHFSHIFIDEAGQATEPETFVSIKTMADPATNIILSGDPKQLGPIIRSGIASKLGLEVSYLERLMSRPPYDLRTGAGKSIVKLVKNFRSHEAILRFPSDRFYGGDLQQCGPTAEINAYIASSYLPNKRFPIVFHAVTGKDDREASSPSFFNIDEIIQVKTYVEQLKADRIFRTRDQDIGVITPYHAQCRKIRMALKSVADEVKVGSVEEFQGQERKVVIISTVRSSKEFVSYDIRHTLGFVASPRRFNVAVTRAKGLLVVVGDPQVLGLDPLWRSFLNYIYKNKAWRGPDIPWDPSDPIDMAGGYDIVARDTAILDMNDFTRRMESSTMEEADEDVEPSVDRPWRDVE